nr:hypothetical protein [Tanacetum cinerariifolium]
MDCGSISEAEDGSDSDVRAQGSDGELFQAEEMVVALKDDQTHDRRDDIEEIRKTFNIKNDLTLEEEEGVRRERFGF